MNDTANDNQNPNPPEENPNAAPPGHCDLTMTFQCTVRVNMEREDPRIQEVFASPDMVAFIEGPLGDTLFHAIQQYAVAKCAQMIMTLPPIPGQKPN